MWPVIVVFIVAMVVLDAGAIASLVTQRSATAHTPAGQEYRVRLTPAGVHWVSWMDWDLSWFGATFHWARYLRSSRKGTWTVAVSPRWASYSDPPVLSETFADVGVARRRVWELSAQIDDGSVVVGA
jgi:hypothetical protein